ncbi:hypothetical protein AOA57_10955 [Pseudomonas sp. 2588-5]|nr:hypothetical protein AOA57_10955 [Pseudomonas sp. 2588-5]
MHGLLLPCLVATIAKKLTLFVASPLINSQLQSANIVARDVRCFVLVGSRYQHQLMKTLNVLDSIILS